MKQFFISLLASILGGIVLLLLFFFLLVGIAASSGGETETVVKDGSWLLLDLDGSPLSDRVQENPFTAFAEALGETSPLGLNTILRNIEKAADDEQIKGIILKPALFLGGAASAKELHTALRKFKQTGKKIYAHGTFFSARGLYLASVADSIILDPAGMLDWTGMSIGVTYYKGMLDKIGVQAEAIRGSNNQFKSAVEPFIQNEMSSSNRLQLQTLSNDLWNEMIQTIASERQVRAQQLQNWADSLSILDAEDAFKKGLCDALWYQDEWLHFLEEELQVGEEQERIVSLAAYNKAPSGQGFSRNKLAILYAEGEFAPGDDGTQVDAATMTEALRDIRKDEQVKALIIRVNSPGGQAWIADKMVREIELVREQMPVVISMGNMAASAGYMISAVGDTIFTQANTITGSIGVFGLMFQAQELLEEKMGLRTFHINTAEYSDFGSPDRPLKDFERATLQRAIDRYYTHFVELVAENRGLTTSFVDSIGQGRVWSGEKAIALGLADALGGLVEAEEAARKMAGLDSGSYRISEYPVAKDPLEELLESLGNTQAQWPEIIENSPLKEPLAFYLRWKDWEGVPLMRLESDLEIE